METSPCSERFTEPAPDRPRLGTFEHPNLDRPGAQPHPRSTQRKARPAAGASRCERERARA